ncbi:hypothetical protein CLOP_g17076, partial [Closterium sp. NIES-67]
GAAEGAADWLPGGMETCDLVTSFKGMATVVSVGE